MIKQSKTWGKTGAKFVQNHIASLSTGNKVEQQQQQQLEQKQNYCMHKTTTRTTTTIEYWFNTT